MAYTRFLDPIGPGTRAWECFDNALEAYRLTPPGKRHRTNYYYKRYSNQRYCLIKALRKEHASYSCIAEWLDSLKQQCHLNPNPEE